MAGTALNRASSDGFTIANIVTEAENGILRIPPFQRSYVWRASDVRALFDSLYRGFPVGTLLLWQRHGPAGVISLGPIEINAPERANALFVVDGQQRIASLAGALSTKLRVDDDRFNVYFDLALEKFITPHRGTDPSRAIPVREALETKTLLNWLRIHSDDLDQEDFDVADRLGAVFRDYKIPAYIVTEDNQQTLRQVFDRVNNSGRPISRAQVFHALFANEEAPASPGSVAKSLRVLKFGDVPENRVVQSLLGIRGGDVQRDIHDEFSDEEDPLDWYDKTEEALTRAIAFLRSRGVYHIDLMPNTLPLPILATFFFVHPEPSPWVSRLLARWLWRGWVHGFGKEGGQTPVLRRAIRSIYRGKGKLDEVPSEFEAVRDLLAYVSDRESDLSVPTEFRTNWAESRLLLLALAHLKPLDANGDVIDLAALFDDKGSGAVSELISGHRTDAAARAFWPPGSPPLKDVTDAGILQSHLVSHPTWHALAAGANDIFLERRRAELDELLPRFLSNRLEVGAILRPPLSELIVVGSEEDV